MKKFVIPIIAVVTVLGAIAAIILSSLKVCDDYVTAHSNSDW